MATPIPEVLLGSDAVERGSFMHNVAANITQLALVCCGRASKVKVHPKAAL